ncbi:tRNA (adenosine(37)-N6)-threonylcarbamoyltransferase complex dimerization subunit type 1 TsaB [Actinokineospora sp. 24-640]
MLVLAVDTATPAVTAGVVEVGDTVAVLAERITVDAKAHGELLTPHVRDALAEAGRALSEVDAIVCGVGPGPFTGLRAGMVSAAALGHALGRPVYPVCSLDAIAASVPGEPLLVVTDARRREVYWAVYDALGVRIDGPHVSPAAEVSAPHAKRVAGAGLYDFGLPLVEPAHPSPAGLVAAARAELVSGAEPGPLTPLYLRRPDAVVPGARKRVSPA